MTEEFAFFCVESSYLSTGIRWNIEKDPQTATHSRLDKQPTHLIMQRRTVNFVLRERPRAMPSVLVCLCVCASMLLKSLNVMQAMWNIYVAKDEHVLLQSGLLLIYPIVTCAFNSTGLAICEYKWKDARKQQIKCH